MPPDEGAHAISHQYRRSGQAGPEIGRIAWGWDYFSKDRVTAIVDRPDDSRIDWEDEDEGERPEFDAEPAHSSPKPGEDRRRVDS
jgi:hypothetical protein